MTEAIVEQAQLMTHCPSAAPAAVRAELYERLVALSPTGLERVLLAVTGAAANELAIQLARAATGRDQVISFSGTYLGRSVGTVGLAGKRAYREQLCVPAGGQFLPYPDPYRSPWAGGADPGELVLGLLEQMLDRPGVGPRPAGVHRVRADPGQRRRRNPTPGLPGRAAAPRATRPARCCCSTRSSAGWAAPGGCGRASTRASCPI